jgi:hypothetical protein
MRQVVFDNVSGQFWTEDPNQATPEDPRATIVEVPENIAAWRLRYNPETSQVVVRYPGMTDAEAEAEMEAEMRALLTPPPADAS